MCDYIVYQQGNVNETRMAISGSGRGKRELIALAGYNQDLLATHNAIGGEVKS